MNADLTAWLRDGPYRVPVLAELKQRPSQPSELAAAAGINRASMSRVLRDLRDRGLVRVAGQAGRSRIYEITPNGLEALAGHARSRGT